MIRTPLLIATVLVTALAAAGPARALTITPVFDASITSLSNAAAVEASFRAAAAAYSGTLSNTENVTIGVSWGSVGGQTLPSSALGASVDRLYGYYSYAKIRAALTASATSSLDKSFVANLPATLSGPSLFAVPSAEARVLGLASPPVGTTDGWIGFAGNSVSGFAYGSAYSPNTYNFQAVAEHEIAEILGRTSGQSGAAAATYRTVLDLGRYSAPGVMTLDYSTPAYLSATGGVTSLGSFNVSPSGGDRSDWASGGRNDVSNAFAQPNALGIFSASDISTLDLLGYTIGGRPTLAAPGGRSLSLAGVTLADTAAPAPGAAAALGLATLAAARRRRA